MKLNDKENLQPVVHSQRGSRNALPLDKEPFLKPATIKLDLVLETQSESCPQQQSSLETVPCECDPGLPAKHSLTRLRQIKDPGELMPPEDELHSRPQPVRESRF
jgi:hypothetical protein